MPRDKPNTQAAHVVVDGSNIATEGRSTPSLKQLREAVKALEAETDIGQLTTVVDATFGHRISTRERPAYEKAILSGELLTPPAGVIGRGDAFILQIADRAEAVILSNDSFQEFHGTYVWLFDEGRLLGGKPVPGLGWVFLPRTPVRGPTSRRAVRDAKQGKNGSTRSSERSRPRSSSPSDSSRSRSSAAKSPQSTSNSGSTRTSARPIRNQDPLNGAMPFIEFVGNHAIGSVVDGEVESFASHGAYILASGTKCYVPLKLMADPPPMSAREILSVGDIRRFVVHTIDTPRRGIDLVLVDDVDADADTKTSGPETSREGPETDAEDRHSTSDSSVSDSEQSQGSEPLSTPLGAPEHAPEQTKEEHSMATNTAKPRKAAAKKNTARATAARRTAAKRTPTKVRAAAKTAPAKKAAAPAKKTTATKAPAKKTAAKKTTATKAPAKKTAAKKTTATKAPAKKTAAKKTAAKQ